MNRTVTTALALAFVVGVALIAVAQEGSSPEPTRTPSATEEELGQLRERFRELCRDNPEDCKRFRRHRRGGKGFLFLHADGVGMDREGKTVDVRIQKGIIRGVDGDSLTLESADGFKTTYVIDDETIVREKRRQSSASDLEEGEMAQVRATKDGENWVARVVSCVGEPGPRMERAFEGEGADA